MKRLLVLLVLVLVLATGCGGVKSPTENEAKDLVVYIHDDVHKVGIWLVSATGKLGGRHIFVLPDTEYANPDESWPKGR